LSLINGHNSIKLPITCGVPQGSILGPFLFLIYINNIANVSNILQLILFADDTNFILIQLVNRELELININFKVNKLSLNVDRTVFIVFTSARQKCDANVVYNRILLNDKPLQQVSTTKFLGVYINEHLNWADHIHQVNSKISKTCIIPGKLKYLLPHNL